MNQSVCTRLLNDSPSIIARRDGFLRRIFGRLLRRASRRLSGRDTGGHSSGFSCRGDWSGRRLVRRRR